ncbi:MAG: TlpA family protein disulfide reductase [Leucothrix sp.]
MLNSYLTILPKLFFLALLSFSVIPANAAPVNDFSFKDIDGKAHDFSDYQGKWVVVNYWAIFCPPCRVEIPDLIRFLDDNPDKVTVLGMDAGMDDIETLKQFATDQKINYPIIPTQTKTMEAFGEVPGLPTTYIVSPTGELVDTHVGLLSYQQLDEYINKKATPKKEKSFWDRLFSWTKG